MLLKQSQRWWLHQPSESLIPIPNYSFSVTIFPVPNLNLPWHNLRSFPLILSFETYQKLLIPPHYIFLSGSYEFCSDPPEMWDQWREMSLGHGTNLCRDKGSTAAVTGVWGKKSPSSSSQPPSKHCCPSQKLHYRSRLCLWCRYTHCCSSLRLWWFCSSGKKHVAFWQYWFPKTKASHWPMATCFFLHCSVLHWAVVSVLARTISCWNTEKLWVNEQSWNCVVVEP